MTAANNVLRYEADVFKLDAFGNFVIEPGPDGKLALVLMHKKGDPVVADCVTQPRSSVVIPTTEGLTDEGFYHAVCRGYKGTQEQWEVSMLNQTAKEIREKTAANRRSFRENRSK